MNTRELTVKPDSVTDLFKLKIYMHVPHTHTHFQRCLTGNSPAAATPPPLILIYFFISPAVKIKTSILQKLNSSTGIKTV